MSLRPLSTTPNRSGRADSLNDTIGVRSLQRGRRWQNRHARSGPRNPQSNGELMMGIYLSELHPIWRRVHKDFTPETGGVPTDHWNLTFQCPACGPPYKIAIEIGPEMQSGPPRVWEAYPPVMPSNVDEWARVLTLSPSINHTEAGHGKRHPHCTFHGSIIAGKIIPS